MLFCFRSDALRQHPFGPKVCGVLGSRATEVWIPDQTSGAQAPCFGGLLGFADWTASRSERFEANRRRRLLGRDRAYARRSGRIRLTGEGSKAASVWPQPKRIGAGRLPRVFSAGAEARHTPRRPCGLPHGEGSATPPRVPLPGKLAGSARLGTV